MRFDPMAQWGQFFEGWQKLAGDSVVRANAIFGELEKAEAKRREQAETAIEEIARLQKETLAYGAQMSAEWRKFSLEAFQKASTFASPATTAV